MWKIPDYKLVQNADHKSSYFQQESVCRLCWSKNGVKDIFHDDHSVNITAMMKECLDIEIIKDTLPRTICKNCWDSLKKFHKFKMFCKEADKKMKEILLNSETKVTEEERHVDSHCSDDEFPDLKLELSDSDMSSVAFSSEELSLLSESEIDDHSSLKNESGDEIENKEENLTNTQFNTENKRKAQRFITIQSLKNNTPQIRPKPRLPVKKTAALVCILCKMDFKTETEKIDHFKEFHGLENGIFKCFGCQKTFKTWRNRFCHEHIFCKRLNNGFKCTKCDRYLPSRKAYECHLKRHILNLEDNFTTENIFQCRKCTESFKTKDELRSHADTHRLTKKNYVCEHCGRVFNRHDYLSKHRATHTGIKHYSCTRCDYRTPQKGSLTIHMRKHTGERPYVCDICPQRCVSSSNLLAHRRRHMPDHKRHECNLCGKKFGYKMSLAEHYSAIHERSHQYPCHICGATYSRPRGLRRHMQSKHPGEKKQTPADIDVKPVNDVSRETSNELSDVKTDAHKMADDGVVTCVGVDPNVIFIRYEN